jgi:hypothetical protein
MLKALFEIRDEVRGGLREVRDEIRKTNDRVDSLERVVIAEAAANRTAYSEVAAALRELRGRRDARLDDHERRLRALERKAG